MAGCGRYAAIHRWRYSSAAEPIRFRSICATPRSAASPNRTDCGSATAGFPRWGRWLLPAAAGSGCSGSGKKEATPPSPGENHGVCATAPLPHEDAARRRREARAMAALSHTNLALIFGAETWRGTPLLIVEYLEAGTLADRLRRGPLPVAEVTNLGMALADGLTRVHNAGLLHRDIKPSNIGFTADGVPKLFDFGVAKIVATPQ